MGGNGGSGFGVRGSGFGIRDSDYWKSFARQSAGAFAVIPAKAGIRRLQRHAAMKPWIPAFAGMTFWRERRLLWDDVLAGAPVVEG
ncbi:hypothetical protein D9T17_01965 [Lysobacter enzymogenes]|uniref:Uncharacterized protein n=1 Tax=Lysobacter enzymogenes TaxID=69 RepID=A0A3N2RN63_LYSEN|nr:hypothetical protein D9T17_01965 [Lysobacter enzymogenes]